MTENLVLKIKRMHKNAKIPFYAKPGDAGMDLCSVASYLINPHERVLVATGWAVEVPLGYEMQIRPRSGLALKEGITVLNTPGTIDSGYRNEIGVILQNHSNKPYQVNEGDRIAQAVIKKVETVQILEVDELSSSERGKGGFGSTGKG